jgi:hypothetical protein
MDEWNQQLKAFFGGKTMEELKLESYIKSINEAHKTMYDKVTNPKHYMLFEDLGIEVRDVIAKLVKKIENSEFIFEGIDYSDYVQMMQYGMRFMEKNGVEDLKKMRWYLDKIIKNYDDAS